MALPVAKCLQTLPSLPITSYYYFAGRGKILTHECIVRSEPVLRLICVDGTLLYVHLSVDHYYRLSCKETRSNKATIVSARNKIARR